VTFAMCAAMPVKHETSISLNPKFWRACEPGVIA
jgi:hypothetical protein